MTEDEQAHNVAPPNDSLQKNSSDITPPSDESPFHLNDEGIPENVLDFILPVIIQATQIERRISIHNVPPILNPYLLEALNKINPGFGDHALTTLKEETAQRRALQERTHTETFRFNFLRLYLGFATLVLLIGLAAFALYTGHPDVASDIATVTIIAVASIFVLGKFFQYKRKPSSRKNRTTKPRERSKESKKTGMSLDTFNNDT